MKSEENNSFWISYSDLATGLLLLFVLIIVMMLLSHKKEIEALQGIRKALIVQLKQAFDKEHLEVDIDPKTGAIALRTEVLFDEDKYELKELGKVYLRNFIVPYYSTLLNSDWCKALDNENEKPCDSYIKYIIIEGHANQKGDYQYNLDLSGKRASEVAKFILSYDMNLEASLKNKLKTRLALTGRSYAEPKYYNADVPKGYDINAACESQNLPSIYVDCEKSKRVEFKFLLVEEDEIEKSKIELLGY
ncbi:MAG TPA: OmpA family protein [bacterium]|nr:OmpA family protein [bacterium]